MRSHFIFLDLLCQHIYSDRPGAKDKARFTQFPGFPFSQRHLAHIVYCSLVDTRGQEADTGIISLSHYSTRSIFLI